jgi:flagellar motility protein MotE (MotC chaperone)
MELEMEKERGTFGPFERFMYLIAIPVIFTAVLSAVLLTLFGYDVVNPLLRAGHKIPVIGELLPEPKVERSSVSKLDAAREEAEKDAKIADLQTQLQALNQQILTVRTEAAEKDRLIQSLEAQLAEAEQALAEQRLSDEAYAARIRTLANVYADMSPSKAAPVLEQLTLNERVLVLNEMDPEAQVDILEKMNPVIAAETSILLKDVIPAKDQQIAALQSRLALLERQAAAPETLTPDEVSLTVAGMPANSAAKMLLELYKSDKNQVIQILRGMDVQSRSAVLDAIAREDAAVAAAVTASLKG